MTLLSFQENTTTSKIDRCLDLQPWHLKLICYCSSGKLRLLSNQYSQTEAQMSHCQYTHFDPFHSPLYPPPRPYEAKELDEMSLIQGI